MSTEEILEELRSNISEHRGDVKDLYEQLLAEAEGWKMVLEEMEEEDDDEDE